MKNNEYNQTNMKKNDLWAKARYLLLAGTVCAGFAACDDDNNEPHPDGNTPGILTATSGGTLESHTMKGAVLLPVSAENPNAEPDPAKFTYENFSLSGEELLDDAPMAKEAGKVPAVTAVEKGENGGWVLVLGYDCTGYASCRVSFTLGYESTATAIPVNIHIVNDLLGVRVQHLAAGMNSDMGWMVTPPDDSDRGYDWTFTGLKGTGAHAGNISLLTLEEPGYPAEYGVALDKLFEFTSEEMAQGYAAIPVQTEYLCKENGTAFRMYDILTVCPSRILEPVTLESDANSHVWYVKDEVEALGLDKYNDGNIYLNGRDYTFYIAQKDGYLYPVRNFSRNIFPSIGTETSGDKVTPYIKLLGIKDLPAGEYTLLLHVKKVQADTDNKLYVDFRMPFVKK